MNIRVHEGATDGAVDGSLVHWLLKLVGNPPLCIKLWNGQAYASGGSRPVATIEFHSRKAFFDVLRSPSVGFGEAYSSGAIEVHGNFLACIEAITAAITEKQAHNYGRARLKSLLYSLRTNTLARSKHNVHHHYDLGNDFYAKWLDERMVYTCAYYPGAASTLAEAQLAKLEHVCRKLKLRPGQTVIDAGCGWGALSLHMAERYGVRVHAYNNSHEQVAYARNQAKSRGLDAKVTFHESDYRLMDERCDAFVSIGMLEHVGLANYRGLGELIARVLKPDGLGLVHTIGRSHPQKMDAWILKHVFPGGHVPSLGEMMAVFEPQQFSILDVENLRPHYARTCADWLANFDAVADEIERDYGAEFVRTWRLYLAGSSAGFSAGTLQLYQVLFAPRDNRAVPWTRDYQYRELPQGGVD